MPQVTENPGPLLLPDAHQVENGGNGAIVQARCPTRSYPPLRRQRLEYAEGRPILWPYLLVFAADIRLGQPEGRQGRAVVLLVQRGGGLTQFPKRAAWNAAE